MVNSLRKIFTDIYDEKKWGYGSGPGSHPDNNTEYIHFVERFIRDNDIRYVVDAGCGDWQFSRFVDWGSASYYGFDVVDSIIENNIDSFSSDNVRFSVYDGCPDNLPSADLLLIKDVLQHLSLGRICGFVRNFCRYRFCLITNGFSIDGGVANQDIEDGGSSFIDLRLEPFNVGANEVLSFYQEKDDMRWLKKTLLIENE